MPDFTASTQWTYERTGGSCHCCPIFTIFVDGEEFAGTDDEDYAQAIIAAMQLMLRMAARTDA